MTMMIASPNYALGSGEIRDRYGSPTEDLVEYNGVWMSRAEASVRAAHEYLYPPQKRLDE
jgi:hypothetical protein